MNAEQPMQGPDDTEADKVLRLPNVLEHYAKALEYRAELNGVPLIDSGFIGTLRRAARVLRELGEVKNASKLARKEALYEAMRICQREASDARSIPRSTKGRIIADACDDCTKAIKRRLHDN